MDPLHLRSHNPFLPPLEAVAPELHPYVSGAVQLLPQLSVSLTDFARYFAAVMVDRYNKRTSDTNVQYLVLCVHDVQLNHVYAHLLGATEDKAVAANYISALLYQGLGKTPKCDDQSIFLGLSYKLRGLEKYDAFARMHPGISDPMAAIFGKEFGQLIFSRTTEDATMLGSSKLLEIGYYTDANIRGIFLGEPFTEEDRARVVAACAEQDKRVSREIQEVRRRNPSQGI
jgi:hypothetical protein